MDDKNTLPNERVLRLKDVRIKTGLSRSTIYAHVKAGFFPERILLGPRSVGWLESDINDWIQIRIQKTREENPS